MTETNSNESTGPNNNLIIIVVTIIVLAAIFMFFRQRHLKRSYQLQRLETQTDVFEEWGPPRQNPANPAGGKIL